MLLLGLVKRELFDSMGWPLQALESCIEAISILQNQIDAGVLYAKNDGNDLGPA